MNIAMVLPYLKAGGTERQAGYIVNYLQKNGHDVRTVSVENQDVFESLFKVPVHYLNSRNSTSLLLFNLFLLLRFIRKKRIEVLISRAWSSNLLCGLASIISGLPNVLFLSASLDMSKHRFYKKLIYQFIFKRCNRVISVSEASKRNCIKWLNIDEDKIVVIHNGVDVKKITELSKEGMYLPDQLRNNTHKKIVFVGRLIHRKGLDILLKSFQELTKNYKVQLIVVGGGSELDQYKTMSEDLGIKENVFFLGEKVNPFPYIKTGELFILPSRSEGFPNVLLEAMALKKPVVATDCETGPSEIIDSSNGTLVEVDNPEKMSLAIINYLENPELAIEHARVAQKTVQKFFKLENQLAEIEKTILSVTQKGVAKQ